MKQKLLQEMIDAHRYLRHDFKNDLQVILGYLQIGQMEKAHFYARRTAEGLEDFNSLGKLHALLMQSYLLSYLTALSNARENLHLRIEGDAQCWERQETELLSCLRAILDPLRDRLTSGDVQLELRILAEPCVRLKFFCAHDRQAADLAENFKVLNQDYPEKLDLNVKTETDSCIVLNITRVD